MQDDASPSNQCLPYLPNEIWGEVLKTLPLKFLWRTCRQVSRVFRTEAEHIASQKLASVDQCNYWHYSRRHDVYIVDTEAICYPRGLDEDGRFLKFDVLSEVKLSERFMLTAGRIYIEDIVDTESMSYGVAAVKCGAGSRFERPVCPQESPAELQSSNHFQVLVDWKALIEIICGPYPRLGIPRKQVQCMVDYPISSGKVLRRVSAAITYKAMSLTIR